MLAAWLTLSLFIVLIMSKMGKEKQAEVLFRVTLARLVSTDEDLNGSSLLVCAGCEAS